LRKNGVIGYIEGSILFKEPALVRVLCQGIGYDIHIPMSTYERLGETGNAVKLETYLHVKEDALQLYGFMTGDEKEVFIKVIGVRGIGPRIALGVLSSMPAIRFVEALQERDIDVLSGIPGVGRKTAERLTVDLRDQFPDLVRPIDRPDFRREEEEAIKALIALGFSVSMARKSVRDVIKKVEGEIRTEDIVKQALGTIR
jgi:Holliday junction DNA helicase RuvA